jgi:hypothetical protein
MNMREKLNSRPSAKTSKGKRTPKTEGKKLPDADLKAEIEDDISEADKQFRARVKTEAKRLEDSTGAEYWLCIVFPHKEAKDDFLRETGLEQIDDRYIDSEELKAVMGMEQGHRKPEWGAPTKAARWKKYATAPTSR